MKSARVFIVVMLYFSVVVLTGCSSNSQDKVVSEKPDKIFSTGWKDFHWPQGKRAAISLSFDDARESQLDCGLPVLDAYDVKATFYVLPVHVKKRLADWKKAVTSGHEIGNHTITHPCSGNITHRNALENYTLEMIANEMDSASDEIERLLGVRPTTFAYPCGHTYVGRGKALKSYVPLVAERFIAGRLWRDEHANDPTICDLPQVMGVELDKLDFEQLKKQIDKAAKKGRWLVLCGHKIGSSRRRQTTMAATIEALCKYANDPDNGIWIDTVETIGTYIMEQRAGRK